MLTTPSKSSLSVCLVPFEHCNEYAEGGLCADQSDLLISSRKASMARLPFGLGTAGGDGDCSHVENVALVERLAHLRRFECAHRTRMRLRSRQPGRRICGTRIPRRADEATGLRASPCWRAVIGVERIQKFCICLRGVFLLFFLFGLGRLFLLFPF